MMRITSSEDPKAHLAGKRRIRNICVYCGSNVGTNPAYAAAPPAARRRRRSASASFTVPAAWA